MRDAMNTLMLICASAAAMAFGVLAAYAICRLVFLALRIHSRSVAIPPLVKQQPEAQVVRVA
jgi:hypothetical protein